MNKDKEKNYQCDVCYKERAKNLVICSDNCAKIRQMIFDLEKEYFPTNGCDNCWGDLHQGCSQQCQKEFRESLKFGTKLWKLVHFITKRIEDIKIVCRPGYPCVCKADRCLVYEKSMNKEFPQGKEGWEEEHRIRAEATQFFHLIERNLPKTQEMAALGKEKVFRAFYPAYVEFRDYFLSQQKARLIEEIKQIPNPYPESVWIPYSEKERGEILSAVDEFLQYRFKKRIDGLSAYYVRWARKAFLEEIIQLLQQDKE